jgi:glycosyltransferase involved in cell wall biosynthesis
VEHFRPDLEWPEPADLAGIGHPRIGFFGGIDEYVVDVDLLEMVAREIPEAELVLVGAASCPMDRFEALRNVHWLGQRPYDAIPRYGAAFDVALMPWVDNEWIAYANPIKLKEYLALGLPVVSTYFPEGEWYRDVIDMVHGREAFVKAARAALEHGGRSTPKERRARVEHSTWDAQAALLMSLCEGEELACAGS